LFQEAKRSSNILAGGVLTCVKNSAAPGVPSMEPANIFGGKGRLGASSAVQKFLCQLGERSDHPMLGRLPGKLKAQARL
jgi:hypothetical protein